MKNKANGIDKLTLQYESAVSWYICLCISYFASPTALLPARGFFLVSTVQLSHVGGSGRFLGHFLPLVGCCAGGADGGDISSV